VAVLWRRVVERCLLVVVRFGARGDVLCDDGGVFGLRWRHLVVNGGVVKQRGGI
jgi:hypothetical protein